MNYDDPTPIQWDWRATEREYRADGALNFHKLADFHRDPRAFREGFFDEKDVTDAMRFGTALHALVLQGEDVYAEKIATFDAPRNPKTGESYGATTKTYKDAYDAFASAHVGKTISSADDDATIRKLYGEFLFHPSAPLIVNGDWGDSEIPVKGALTLDDGSTVDVKGLIDRYSSRGLIDVKTTAALDDAAGRDKFRYAIYDYKYLVQLGFYHLILAEVYGAPFVPCWIIAFERNAPNRVAVYKIAREVIEKARGVAKEWLREYATASRDDYFPSKFEEVRLIDAYSPEKDLY